MVKRTEKVVVVKWLIAFWALLSATFAFAHYEDADLKAVYLYRFALLADWVATGEPVAPVEYCVSENDSVAEHLQRIVARKPQLSRFYDLSKGETPSSCHILYLTQADSSKIATRRKQFPHSLLIGDGDKFIKKGGMVAFVKENNRIRPMISRNHIAPTKVQLRAQLLSISILAEDEVAP
ncbi:YfiR family protein [Vibrio harveyi]|uniref:YfiR family protein n=1 Tax=Vibrio harveyi TaxID=669 RepID=UPI00069E0E50|nr:YfiR family protein [Vibrio harveyi]KNY42163.1 valyl-tRNA synthetase [Vibrio harveyi]